MAIYGGFAGTETSLAERDWETNLTTLSGDIGTSGINTDNSYHVVTGSGLSDTTILDGFSISGGNANGSSPDNNGGGIYNSDSNPTLTNIIISNNSASNVGGGMYNYGGSAKLTNVDFLNNSARYGAGLNNAGGDLKLTDVLFSGNTATNSGGGMENGYCSPELINVTFSGNTSGDSGGGMNSNGGSPTLKSVTFSGNTSASGGGLRNNGSSPTLINVTFSNNTATIGGGMSNTSTSNPILTNVTFSENSATRLGGGMYNNFSYPTLTNITFSANTSNELGGGMYNYQSRPTLTNITFSANTAIIGGGGIYNKGVSSNGSYPVVVNSILWANTPDQISNDSWSTTTITYSTIQGGGFAGEGNIDLDPDLGELTDNGGFTQTHALGEGSPAIDAGDPDNCPATDQRGFYRPIDGDGNGTATCDMGAFEYASYLEVFTLTVDLVGSGSVAKDPDQTEYQLGETVTLTATADPGWDFTNWSGDADSTDNPLIITILGDTNITANFTQNEYTLNVSVDPIDSGSVLVDPMQDFYHYGDQVTLTPTANSGWTFTGWTGDVISTDKPLTITIEGDTNITATFTQDEYTLSVTPIGSGSVAVDPLQDTYLYNDAVTLTATADPGWDFTNWSGDSDGTDNPLIITILGDTNITANFEQVIFKIYLPLIVR